MNVKRKIVAFVIITVALAASIIIIYQPQKNSSKTLFSLNAISPKGVNSNLEFSQKKSPQNLITNLNQPVNINNDSLNQKETNMTEAFIDLYNRTIFSQNPNEMAEIIMKGEAISGKNIENFIETLNPQFNQTPFEAKDIKISSNNSKETKLIYLQQIKNVSKKHLGSINFHIFKAVEELFKNKNDFYLNRILTALPPLMEEMLKISVPSELKNFHLDALNILQEELTTYQFISSYQDDPLKAYLAVQNLPQLAERDINLGINLEQMLSKL